MRRSITISLPEQVIDELDSWVDARGISRSDAACEAIQDYLFIRRFRELGGELTEHGGNRGLHTDQDVLREISRRHHHQKKS